jgi:hypothetical protein
MGVAVGEGLGVGAGVAVGVGVGTAVALAGCTRLGLAEGAGAAGRDAGPAHADPRRAMSARVRIRMTGSV